MTAVYFEHVEGFAKCLEREMAASATNRNPKSYTKSALSHADVVVAVWYDDEAMFGNVSWNIIKGEHLCHTGNELRSYDPTANEDSGVPSYLVLPCNEEQDALYWSWWLQDAA